MTNIYSVSKLFWSFSAPHVTHCVFAGVEFYLYPTVSTALIYLVEPELNKWDQIVFLLN